jgi:predicted N-acetyltransferase YhbS
MTLKIELLADHQNLVPLLAEWFYREWGGRSSNDTLQVFSERLLGRMNRDKPPLTLVAFNDKDPVGTAALKIREMETHPQYRYWLGSVYVTGNQRGLGIGSALVEAVIREAERLKIPELYLYTRVSESLYSRLGWKEIERTFFRGRIVTIMKQDIPDRV